MPLDPHYYIHTRLDGDLTGSETGPDAVRGLAGFWSTANHLVIHLHGGLVSNADASASAERLLPVYQAAGFTPLFVAWETGFGETVRNLLQRAWDDSLFRSVVKQVTRFTVGSLRGEQKGLRGRGPAAALPDERAVELELEKRKIDVEPFAS